MNKMLGCPSIRKNPVKLDQIDINTLSALPRDRLIEIARVALNKSRLDFLKPLKAMDILPDNRTIIASTCLSTLEAYQWLFDQGVFNDKKLATKTVINAFDCTRWDLVGLFESHGILPNHKAADHNIYEDRNIMKSKFEWLAARNIFPTARGANRAEEYGKQDALALMASYGVYPDPTLPEKPRRYY